LRTLNEEGWMRRGGMNVDGMEEEANTPFDVGQIMAKR
jgi:hypothetical protein